MTEALNDKYLGFPANVGMDISGCFQFMIGRIIIKISGWKEKLLSVGGKEILHKSVVQAIPAYAMSVFKIPKKIVKELSTRCRNFGGVTRTTRRECIEWHGGKCVYQKIKEVWVLEIYIVSIWLC